MPAPLIPVIVVGAFGYTTAMSRLQGNVVAVAVVAVLYFASWIGLLIYLRLKPAA